MVIPVNLRGELALYGVRFSSYGIGAKEAKKGLKKPFPQKIFLTTFFW